VSQWRQTWDLIRREFVQRAKSRGFQIMMLVTVGLVMSIIPLMAIALGDPPPTRIGVTSAVPDGTEGALQQRAAELDVAVIVRSYSSESTAETALRDGDVQVVYTGSAIVFLEEESTTAKAVVTGAAALLAFRAAANALGIPEAELAQVLAPPELEATILSPPDPEEEPRRIGSLVGLILLYMSILIFGQFVALGVMEEKQSRVVEVVLSRVAPDQVLIAKVVGIGALGLVQIAALGGAIWLALSFVDIADVSLPVLGAEILASVVFCGARGNGVTPRGSPERSDAPGGPLVARLLPRPDGAGVPGHATRGDRFTGAAVVTHGDAGPRRRVERSLVGAGAGSPAGSRNLVRSRSHWEPALPRRSAAPRGKGAAAGRLACHLVIESS
jgi:hypothetical protein